MIYIAADGGGSKLLAFAFDENLNVLAKAKSGGVNSLFMDAEEARNNMAKAADALFDGLKNTYGEIRFADGVYCTMAGGADNFVKEISRHAEVKNTTILNEGQLGVLAGTLGQNGMLAIAGTGSDCFLVENGKSVGMVGGWGQYFGDEGSGFDIGKNAIIAAIRSYDGRGPKTLLESLVFQSLGLKNSLWEVCAIHRRKTFRKDVSALTKAVETACENKDAVALRLVEHAADELVLTAVTLMKQHGRDKDSGFLFTTAGGAWKTAKTMTERFVSGVKKQFPYSEFIKPEFEPVVGCAVRYIFDRGDIPKKEILTEKFRDYLL